MAKPYPNVTPLNDRVFIEPDEPLKKVGRILIPESARAEMDKGMAGTVVAVAKEGRTLECGTVLPMPVSLGDRVIFGKYSGTLVDVDGERYQAMRSEDIYGILK